MLLLGLGTWVFIVKNRATLYRMPGSKILLAAYYVLVGTWFATVLEGFFYDVFFNLVEHAGQAVSATMAAVWCWKVFISGKTAR